MHKGPRFALIEALAEGWVALELPVSRGRDGKKRTAVVAQHIWTCQFEVVGMDSL